MSSFYKSSVIVLLFLIPKIADVRLNCSEGRKWKVSTLISCISFQKCLHIKLLMSILQTHADMHCAVDFPPRLGVHSRLYSGAHVAPAHQSPPAPETIHAS